MKNLHLCLDGDLPSIISRFSTGSNELFDSKCPIVQRRYNIIALKDLPLDIKFSNLNRHDPSGRVCHCCIRHEPNNLFINTLPFTENKRSFGNRNIPSYTAAAFSHLILMI